MADCNGEVDLEDVHMNIEHRLIELIGDTGKKLHTGRSRNDQSGDRYPPAFAVLY